MPHQDLGILQPLRIFGHAHVDFAGVLLNGLQRHRSHLHVARRQLFGRQLGCLVDNLCVQKALFTWCAMAARCTNAAIVWGSVRTLINRVGTGTVSAQPSDSEQTMAETDTSRMSHLLRCHGHVDR